MPAPEGTPQLSIVLVSYHSRADLERCLPTLRVDPIPEVIVVDNCPGDGTGEWLRREWPGVQVLDLPSNPGYAGGNNAGLAAARGSYILILNPDTEIHPGAIGVLLEVGRRNTEALITPKMLQPDGTVNTCGNRIHMTGITTCLGLGEPADRFTGVFPVPLLSGSAILAHRDVWRAVGEFDESYFMYHEDTDLSLRARSLGYRLLCAADAEITHHYSLAMTPGKFSRLEANRLTTAAKNYDARTLIRLLPGFVLTELATGAYATLRGPAYMRGKVQAYKTLWSRREAIARARQRIAGVRTGAGRRLLHGQDVELPFGQLVDSARAASLLGGLTTPLYRALLPRKPEGDESLARYPGNRLFRF